MRLARKVWLDGFGRAVCILALVGCVGAGTVAFGQAAGQPEPIGVPQPAMVLGDFESLALGNNPTLVQAGAQVQAARGRWVQVGLYPNPVVGYVGSEIGDDGKGGMNGPFWNQELVTAGKLRLNRAAAAAEVRRAEQDWQAQQLRVLTDVRRAFYQVLVAQQQVDICRRLVEIGEEGVRATEALLRALEVSRGDTLQAKVEADTARLLLVAAENRHLAAWRQLSALVGVPQMPVTVVMGNVDEPATDWTWESALSAILSQSPELQAAQAQVNQARWELERALVEPIPNLDLQNSVQYDSASNYTIGNVQVGVALPLFNRNQGAIREAQANLTDARANVARLELELTNRLADVFERYSNAKRQVAQYRETILPNAQSSLELVRKGYLLEEFNYVALLTAQRTYFQTNLNYLSSLVELRTSEAEIQGLVLTGSLNAQ